MKRKAPLILTFILLLSAVFNFNAFGDYREPVDGIPLKPGLNPVIMIKDENTLVYAVYARDMSGLENGDLTVSFDASKLRMVSFDKTGNYDMIYCNEKNGNLYISFVYNDSNKLDAVKLFVITFEKTDGADYPKLTAENIAGTFIRSVAQDYITEYKDDNSQSGVILGDVDGDGRITAADARYALRISANLEKHDDRRFKAADVNKDGFVTSSDARTILRISAGLEKSV